MCQCVLCGLPLYDSESCHYNIVTLDQLSESYCRGRSQTYYVCDLPLYDSESWSTVDKPSIPIVELDSTGLQ